MKIVLIVLLFALATAELAPLLHTDNANVIPGSFIIILKDGLNSTHLDDHVKELHVKFASGSVSKENQIVHLYSIGSLTGFSAWLSNDMVQEQLAHPNVKYIEADQTMSINYIQERAPLATNTQSSATWGIDRIDQPALPLSGTYVYNSIAGAGVDVYVIDTGILTTHKDFEGRATAVFNAITGESGQDLNGHGTHCAGTIGGATYGVAKKVTLKAVKVLSASGSGSNAGVIAGVDYVTNDKTTSHPKVGSMSLGGGASTTLDTAVQKSIAAGVTYAIAAGNDNANACNSSPARVATAITVGATTSTDARSSFSNFGSCVSLFAPGSSITSDWIGTSNSATNTISGTSMATPHVAGAIALAIAQGTATTPAAIKTLFTTGANSNANRVTSPGASSPNYLLYTNPK